MTYIFIIGLIMVLISVWFTYKEYMRWYLACKAEPEGLLKPFRCLKHSGKLIPVVADLLLATILSSLFGFGAGWMGGVTGLFASNCMSGIIYYHTHIKSLSNLNVNKYIRY